MGCEPVILAVVSIHAPREGCDFIVLDGRGYTGKFQFTHPGRGATRESGSTMGTPSVSIHAPREGCDAELLAEYKRVDYVSIHAPREGYDFAPEDGDYIADSFNSRTPGGVRHGDTMIRLMVSEFQFTHPGRGATG